MPVGVRLDRISWLPHLFQTMGKKTVEESAELQKRAF